MSPKRPSMSVRFQLSAAASAAVIAAVLTIAGAVQAQNNTQGSTQGKAQNDIQSPPPVLKSEQGTPKRLLDQKDHGAVLQHGGTVGQYDRAPGLALDATQKAALKRAVLAGDNAQFDATDFSPAPGGDVPSRIKLHPMPADIQQRIPALKYYHFANIADRQIAVVDAMTHKVVDVIAIEPASQAAAPRGADPTASAAPSSGTPGANERAQRAMNSEAGRGGKAEPGTYDRAAIQNEGPMYERGVLNVPGAPRETQTKPAKFSEINNKLDERLIMAGGPGLTDAEAAEVYRAVMADQSAPAVAVKGEPATALPNLTPAQPWPDEIVKRHPGLSSYGYVKTRDRVLIVTPANKIVVGWIDANGQNPAAYLGQRGKERRKG